jgi:hypothetical protein
MAVIGEIDVAPDVVEGHVHVTDQEVLEVVLVVGLQIVRQPDAVDERGAVEGAVAQMDDELARKRAVHDVVGQLVEVLRVIPIRGTHLLADVRVRERREVHRRLGSPEPDRNSVVR